MMQEIKKELRFGLRSGKLLVLTASFLFFALLTPVMLKTILPQVLGSRLSGDAPQALLSIMQMTQTACIQSYMGDVFEIGSIIVAFTLCGLMAQEIRENTLVLPLCSGKRFAHILGAKLVVFGLALLLIPILALMADYVYAGILFSFEASLPSILRGGLLQGVFMVFLLSCLILWGTLMKKPIPAGFLTLATVFGLYFTGELFQIHGYLPSGLLIQAQRLSEPTDPSLAGTLCITALLVFAMTAFALRRLESMEWNERRA